MKERYQDQFKPWEIDDTPFAEPEWPYFYQLFFGAVANFCILRMINSSYW